jgi:hypothetical protein
MKPFAYLLKSKIDGRRYYGIRYCKDADPIQLWTTYFTSSPIVESYIAKYGKDSFEVEIRKVFETAEQALNWEHRILTRIDAANRSDWLNLSNGYQCWGARKELGYTVSESTKKKMSRYAKNRTEDHWKNWKESRMGRSQTEETKKKIGNANRGRKQTEEANEKRRKWSTGQTHSDEVKQKIREAVIGRRHSPETIAKIKAARQRQTEQGHLRNYKKLLGG